MKAAHLEVTYGGVLAAIDGGVERPLTSEGFSSVFEKMADRLHGMAGLSDPGLWGQASNGRIEMEFFRADTGDAEAMTARAAAVVNEVGAAGGVDMSRCGRAAIDVSGSVVHEPQNTAIHAEGQLRFVSNAGHRATKWSPLDRPRRPAHVPGSTNPYPIWLSSTPLIQMETGSSSPMVGRGR